MILVPDKIYSSKGATADVFSVSGLILELIVIVVKYTSCPILMWLCYVCFVVPSSKLLTIALFINQ